MPRQIDEPGSWRAMPVEWAVTETKTHLLQFFMRFRIIEAWQGKGEWENVEAHDLEQVAYFNLEKKNGTLNETNIQALKKALGWNGLSFGELSDGAWQDCVVIIETDWEEYQGRRRMKVKWLNPLDWEPGAGVKPIVKSKLEQADERFRAGLRALAGQAEDLDIPEDDIPF